MLPLISYAAEMHRLSGADDLDCELFNQYKLFGTWAQAEALGLWRDSLHMSNVGAYMACKELVRRFYLL